jgi:hypothetical protein
MARQVSATPKKWREEGIWYYPDVGDNQATWRRYRALREKAELEDTEREELAELEPQIPELFAVRIGPYSHDEYSKIESAARAGTLDVRLDTKSNEVHFGGDAVGVTQKIMFEICAKRIFEVRNYIATEADLDANGELQRGPDGEVITKSKAITTGAALVKFVRTEAEAEEVETIADIFNALRKRSHLEAGQKKTFPALLAS